jgi:TonB family protein
VRVAAIRDGTRVAERHRREAFSSKEAPMKFAVISVVLVSACASTGGSLDPREPSAHTPLTLKVEHDELTALREFPARLSPAVLRSADRARLSGTLVAAVRLCVAPDGRVTSAKLLEPSASTLFDQALVADVATWSYAPYAAPAEIAVCQRVSVTYVAD